MVSGITTNEAVNEVYKKLRIGRTLKGIILKINEQTELEVEKEFPAKDFNHDEFVSAFPTNEGRFGIIDISYDKEDRKDYKIVFILWCPIAAKAIQKMKYSTSVNGIIDGLGSIGAHIQADCAADISVEKIVEKLHDRFGK
jgi:hypothetical protein